MKTEYLLTHVCIVYLDMYRFLHSIPFHPFPPSLHCFGDTQGKREMNARRNKGEQHQEHQHQQHQYYASVMITSRVAKPTIKCHKIQRHGCDVANFRRKRCWFQLRFHATPWPHQCIWVLLPEGQPGQLHHTTASLEFFKETLNWCATSWWNGWKWYEMITNPPKKYHLIQQRHPSSSYP